MTSPNYRNKMNNNGYKYSILIGQEYDKFIIL